MPAGSAVVLGAGVAGLATALLLARDGTRVTLVERDAVRAGEPGEASAWQRQGIPHFLQPHAFIPRGRAELRRHLPDVHEDLLAAGAQDVDLRRKLPGPAVPADEELQYLAVRRPLLEWALRRAVAAEPGIEVRDGEHVRGLGVEDGRVVAVTLDGGALPADVVVDALGRRTPVPEWLRETGDGRAESSECGVVHYSRYYRCRDGFELPDGPWLLSPRGDLGYFGYASFPGDNRTFATVLAVPPGVAEWRMLKDAPAYESAVARIPALAAWADPAGVDPITGVLPMAGLRNTLRRWDPAASLFLVPVGDAYAHTDPVLAHGLAFAVIHAAELATALREHTDPRDRSQAYATATGPALRERFDLATELDAQRLRMWLGEPVRMGSADGDYALFSQLAAGAVAVRDVDVFRVFVRRIGLLDSTAVLDHDRGLQQRIEELFAAATAGPRRPSVTSREEMVAALDAALSPARRPAARARPAPA